MGARGTPSLDAEVDADEVAVAMAAVAERLEDAEATSVCVLVSLCVDTVVWRMQRPPRYVSLPH
jgi:hypothetical protein